MTAQCTFACRTGACDCGGVLADGTLRSGTTFHLPLMLKDGASPLATSINTVTPERKPWEMLSDSEKRNMRDSVRGMPLHRAAALPIYDGVRGTFAAGRPAEQYYALVDGAVETALGGQGLTHDNIQRAANVLASRMEYNTHLTTAWQSPGNDNRRRG